MSELLQKIRQWSHYCQLLGKRGTHASQVLQQIIGVYSAHPSGPLSLLARISGFTPADFHALDQHKLAYRIPVMRESAYLISHEQASQVFSATIPPETDPYWQKRYSQSGRLIPADNYASWKQSILQAIATEPLPIDAVQKACPQIPADIMKPLLNRMAYEGYLLRVGASGLRSNSIMYVSAAAWSGGEFTRVPTQEALVWLAAQYLSAFGPARVKDFQWWAGISAAKAKEAIAAHPTVEVEKGLLLPRHLLPAFEKYKAPNADQIDILPQWDTYTMGYAPDGRTRFVSPDKQVYLYGKLGATGGNGVETILVNGLAHGTWRTKISGSKMHLQLNLFEKPGPQLAAELQKQFAQIAQFLSLKISDTHTSII